jgi:hypothetical protein
MPRPKKKTTGKQEQKSIAFRTSSEYAVWVEGLAAHNRSTVAGLLDQALVKFAKEIGYKPEAPER